MHSNLLVQIFILHSHDTKMQIAKNHTMLELSLFFFINNQNQVETEYQQICYLLYKIP